jgi:hypothetical protein
MASIGQGVVVEAPCTAVVEMVAKQLLETIYIVPPKRYNVLHLPHPDL